MNKETLLLSKAIQDRDLTQLFQRNVNDSWFIDNEDRKVWSLLKAHFTNYGECPSIDVVKDNFPSYQVVQVNDSIEYLLDELISSRRKSATITMIGEAIEHIEKRRDHEGALIEIQKGLIKLEQDGLTKSSDIDISENPTQRWDEYLYRKENPGLLGVTTGFPTIDLATGGLQNGQLIIIVAPPKTGKSTLALQIAQNVHIKEHKVPMFQSFEMTNQEQLSRYDAMRARVSHTRLQRGALNPDEESRYLAKLKGMENLKHKFWLIGATEGATVSAIASKIQVHQPDVVFIDGMYLMIDENGEKPGSPQALTNITRSLKRLAQRVNKPIVISTQVLENKMRNGQVTTDAIGYSSSFHQDADVIFGLQREDENVDDTRLLKVIASRNSGPAEVSLLWDWNTGAFREITADDL